MSPFFTAWLVFMFILSIGGAMFDGFSSRQSILVTVLVSLMGAGIGYYLAALGSNSEE